MRDIAYSEIKGAMSKQRKVWPLEKGLREAGLELPSTNHQVAPLTQDSLVAV